MPELPIPNYDPTTLVLCAVVPERLLSWELRATEICADAARRDQVIEHIAENRCLYYSTDAFLGVDAQKIMDEHGDWVKRAFDETAIALKKRSERIYADHNPRNRLSYASWGE
ncbi:hypothetical protein [Rhodococcus sp. OK302]|uniref:hypothetical protein n=1 Tax=Rhodococcus sp. OK302 TaxID=1882769 RepID=UPI000B9F214F|nr:hypothetical protein [Rhodococcus sp. OK302]OYD71653.1 hypothetical protein BDB13_5331 [Rhodococcus sp. OK302]